MQGILGRYLTDVWCVRPAAHDANVVNVADKTPIVLPPVEPGFGITVVIGVRRLLRETVRFGVPSYDFVGRMAALVLLGHSRRCTGWLPSSV